MTSAEAAVEFSDRSVLLAAHRTLPFSPAQVYAVLADLERHWPLLGADLVEAGIVDGSGAESAELIVRGPVPGLQRQIVTRVTVTEQDRRFGGIAEAGSTNATIDWLLEDTPDGGTLVEFAARIEPGGLRDRMLLAAASPWLDRRCRQVLSRLEREVAKDA